MIRSSIDQIECINSSIIIDTSNEKSKEGILEEYLLHVEMPTMTETIGSDSFKEDEIVEEYLLDEMELQTIMENSVNDS